MDNESPSWADEPQFWAVVPVLATTDVRKTAEYYRDVLGFKIDDTYFGNEWAMLWADQCQLYLSLDPSMATTAHGQQVAICAPAIDDLYDKHKANGANVVSDAVWYGETNTENSPRCRTVPMEYCVPSAKIEYYHQAK